MMQLVKNDAIQSGHPVETHRQVQRRGKRGRQTASMQGTMVCPWCARPAAHGAQPATPRLQQGSKSSSTDSAQLSSARRSTAGRSSDVSGEPVSAAGRLTRGGGELERGLTLVVLVQRGGRRDLPQRRAGARDRARQLLAHQVGVQAARLQQRLVRAHRLHGAVGDHPARAAERVSLSEARGSNTARRASETGCPPCSYQRPRLRRLWRLGCAAPAPQPIRAARQDSVKHGISRLLAAAKRSEASWVNPQTAERNEGLQRPQAAQPRGRTQCGRRSRPWTAGAQ